VNHVTDKILTGTLGELLVQIRLLQCGVQAAPPVKDSGNDLIAVNGTEFRAVSVRTTTTGTYNKPEANRLYHVLAVVYLIDDENEVFLDDSKLFFIPKAEVAAASTDCQNLGQYIFSRQHVGQLFGALQE
jgi:hypothetical protein